MAFSHYVLTGAVATATHYALLAALVERLQVQAGWAAAIGASAGALVAYTGNRYLTFRTTRAPHAQALPRFVVVAALGVVVSGAVVHLGTRVLNAHYLAAQAVATLLVLVLGYRLNRRWSFA